MRGDSYFAQLMLIMKLLGILFFSFCLDGFFLGVLCAPSLRNEGTSAPLLFSEVQASKRSPLVLLKENGQGPHASLFKLLSGHDPQDLESDVSRPTLDSRAVKYMKKLYKMFATEEGVLKTNKRHLYNTVRLVSPHAECKHPITNGNHSIDLFFSLDCVTASEHLLKSALLLFDESVSTASNLTCVSKIIVEEKSSATSQVCMDVPHAMVFNLHFELRRKWIEIDVTTILHPWIVTKKRNLHIAVNFICLKNEHSPNSEYDFFNIAQRSIFLLLYTADTSEHTYHRWNFFRKKLTISGLNKGPFTVPSEEARKGLKQGRAPRHRREDGKMKNTPVPIFNISQYYKQFSLPQNECELHSFWLEFSELNWDKWIIAPHRYNPHYCKGDCPRIVGHRYGSPRHAVVQNLMREKLDSSVPELSCIPADYSPLSVLKVEADKSIVYKEYQNMVAKTCTCR
ncbi:growth/differentiation factor 9 [Pseudonaja textilis]|uniref:growth/differentiation factor 9 n=1 Tax=Pseudonaja textilis TaxID=8673 RepID=UPI000EA895DD|nr:growth/differentiation factor 9 [Pseudonaja textilis]